MKIVEYNDNHYPKMVELWERCGWIPCPKIALPDIGYAAESEDGNLIAYLGMYAQAGKIGFIDWALADHENGISSGKALCRLVDKMIEKAREMNCYFVYSTTKNETWKKILNNRGMKTAESGAYTFVMALNNDDTAFISD